ncbi:MAG: spermidine/putrescine ABC transporter substrate-binding protein [Eubacteriales bacterium]|nr:spermidine/putrescine ABC transporter substrate-binding protein [Eubacteriales bacterium]
MKKLALALALVLALAALTGCGGSNTVTLNVLNWGDYIDEELITQFEDENPNIRINYTNMASNEEMLIKLSAPDCIYDLCFPSDYIIEKLVAEDMLHPLNKANIPNIKNIDSRFMDLSFDPGNTYSVPYMWGVVGILYNTKMVTEPVTSWNVLWDEKYADQILMYDSIRDTIGITLKKLGYSINTREEAHIQAAQDALIAQKPIVQAYLDDPIKSSMIAGNAALAVVYSGDAVWCMEENPDLAYAVPVEGSNVWFDNVIIPKTSQHTAEAEAFINFLCDPEVAKANTEYIGYSTPNAAALALLDPEMLADETYNPPQEVLDRCEIFHDLGDFIEVYNAAWNHIKAA